MKVLVESNNLMDELSVVVISKSGLVLSKYYPESKDHEKFNFSLAITEDMAPASELIAFFSRNGEIYYGTQSIELGFIASNYVSILFIHI
jgi:Alpha-2-macroglobulin bait region domain